MPGVLLDTHTLYWLATSVEALSQESLLAIARSQGDRSLFVSPITAWELTIAAQKPAHRDPPVLEAATPSVWFSRAVSAIGARLIPITQKIACEAASVVVDTGHKDPGDCFLIATARIKKIPIITRDAIIARHASAGYLQIIGC